MQLNVKEFYWALEHASVGNVFDYIQLIVTPTKVKSSLSTSTRSLTTILNFDNNFLLGMDDKEILEMNFHTPNLSIMPHLKLFSKDLLDCTLIKSPTDQVMKMKVKEKETKMTANWNLAETITTKIFSNPRFADSLEFFTEIDINEEFSKQIQALKKIAFNTGKIYFTTTNRILNIETGDRNQNYINTFQIELDEINKDLSKHFDNIAICLDAQVFMSVMNQIEVEKNFQCKLAYKPEKKMGMLCVSDKDSTETYIIPQIVELNNNN